MTPESQPVTGSSAASEPLPARDLSPVELGRRIKMIRVSRGLTLKDLEERGGISATHVSEIERGKASPTIGALGRIAVALGLRPATLIEPRRGADLEVTTAAERPRKRVLWGQAVIEPVTESGACSGIGSQIVTLPIGREPALTHRHEGEEWLTVLNGVAEVKVGDQSYVLREGDSLHFRASRDHSYSNLSSSPAVLLTAVLPRIVI